MKKQSIIRFAVLLLVCCVMLGCAKDNTTTTIYGTVFNSVTHEPIAGAQIEVGFRTGNDIAGYYISSRDHRISSSVSGADGQFELLFGEVQIPTVDYFCWYYIYGTAAGYEDYYQPTGIAIGSNFRMDVNLDPGWWKTIRTKNE